MTDLLHYNRMREQRDELLVALKAMVEATRNFGKGLAEARRLADAAIAKAEGES